MTLEEWQKQIDSDFPDALTCHRVGTDKSFRTTCLTPYEFDGENIRLMFFALDNDGYDFRLIFRPESYKQIQTEPVSVFQIECTDGNVWTFAASIPKKLSDKWKDQRAHDRDLASRGGV